MEIFLSFTSFADFGDQLWPPHSVICSDINAPGNSQGISPLQLFISEPEFDPGGIPRGIPQLD